MLRIALELLAAIGFWIASFRVSENLSPELQGGAIGFAAAFCIESIVWLVKERKYLPLYISTLNPVGRKEIRLTIAYLFKIEIRGRYLLVKSNRLDNMYQPVGGVYKYFHPEATKDLEKMEIITDANIPIDDDNEFDLRLKMKKRINLRAFLKWFHSDQERELDPWREFYEELVHPGILPREEFGFIYSELIGQHYERIHFDEQYRVDTFKYADIYRPRFANDRQEQLIAELQNHEHEEYIWATEQEIKAGRTQAGRQIAPHTVKIFCVKHLST